MKNKKLFGLFILIFTITCFVYILYDNKEVLLNEITYINEKYLSKNIKQVLVDNEYRKKENYSYVQINNNTNIKDIDELKNSIYTFLDAGWDKYIIKCDPAYASCVTDIKKIAEDKSYLTNISNFVHPFNSFENISTQIASSGKITLNRKNRYTSDQIEKINEKVDKIYKDNYDSSKNVTENIKIFHDYIINNTKYDKDNKSGKSTLSSSGAYGVLFDGVGICSGYADAMSLFLDKLHVKNYRISSDTHVWNLVYVEGSWKHLDLTWDDPITDDGSNILEHEYFLISYDELKKKEDDEHDFDETIYKEAL